MSDYQDNEVEKQEDIQQQYPVQKKYLSIWVIIVSIVVIAFSVYLFIINNMYNHDLNNIEGQISQLEDKLAMQSKNLEEYQTQNRGLDISQDNIDKLIQKNIDNINKEVSVLKKDVTKTQFRQDLKVSDIQFAITKLLMAKDILFVSGDKEKANIFVKGAYNLVNKQSIVGVNKQIFDGLSLAIDNYNANTDILKTIDSLNKKVVKLEFLSVYKQQEYQDITKYSKLKQALKSLVKVEKIPQDRKLLTSNHKIDLVSVKIYMNLAILQESLLVKNTKILAETQQNLKNLLDTYFVKNDNSVSFVREVANLKITDSESIENDFTNIINKLSKAQQDIISIN